MMPTDNTPPVGIVGAGISGILAARTLAEHDIPFWIIDKARGSGGRMATRRLGEACADHGAQYFTARDPRFRAIVEQLIDDGTLLEWATGFRLEDGTFKDSGEPRLVAASGMNAFPTALAEGVGVELSCRATSIRHDATSWVIEMDDGPSRRASALIVTSPVPQTLALLDEGKTQLPSGAREALGAIRYDPCFALLVVTDAPSHVPPPGGVWPADGPFAWIADNHQKGISAAHTITFHTRPEYSRARIDDDRDVIESELLFGAQRYLGGKIIEHQLHRWLYSIPTVTHPERFLAVDDPGPIVFAGDAFGGPRVEGAALSGLAAADHLIGVWKNSS